MKIFYVAQVRFPTEKAHGIQIAKICSALSRAGHEVELLVPARENSIESDAFDFYSLERTFKVAYLKTRASPRNGLGFLLEGFEFLWKARQIIGRDPSAAVYTRDLLAPFFFRAVVEIHDLPRRDRRLYSLAWKRARAIVAKTSFLKDDVASRFGVPPASITVIPNGIDFEEFDIDLSREEARKKLGWSERGAVVLYTGSFYGWKGADLLLDVARKEDGATFVFIGGGDGDVREKRDLYPEANILFLGQKPHRDIPFCLRAADVLVLPNRKGEDVSEKYTSPLKLFEYMASGTPIVASKLPSITEIVKGEEAYLFEPNDADALARSIREALSSPRESRDKAQRAREKAKTLTWDGYARKIAILLQ